MSELRSVIEAYRAEVVAELPDARLEEDFAELHRAVEELDAERLRRLAEIDRRRLYERDGHLSAASWLAAGHRLGWGPAREQVRLARAVDDMPEVRDAFEAGAISMASVRVLAAAYDVDALAFGRSVGPLVEAARRHSVADLQRVVAVWRDRVEAARSDDADAKRERRRFHASPTFGGMVRVDGDLDPETGETLLTALHSVLNAEARSRGHDDARSPAQRRADAIGEICRQYLDRGDRPTVAGERPHVTLTIDAETFAAAGSGLAGVVARGAGVAAGDAGLTDGVSLGGFEQAGPVDIETARRLTCDASVMRMVLRGRSEPLDVGRRTPIISPALRRAVIARDRCCRFPGCDRPAVWCDVHHVEHWADGGETCLGNLILLCRRHHRLVHRRNGFRLELIDGLPVFRRPDGSILEEDRAPP